MTMKTFVRPYMCARVRMCMSVCVHERDSQTQIICAVYLLCLSCISWPVFSAALRLASWTRQLK